MLVGAAGLAEVGVAEVQVEVRSAEVQEVQDDVGVATLQDFHRLCSLG